jgi:hypothetical protein
MTDEKMPRVRVSFNPSQPKKWNFNGNRIFNGLMYSD